jgi:RHH-type proline utilization regulon transcriptional repressor/proline dehydrogenase/delta 1-pyrroline-5-carboxylate dehydrogenase
VRERVSLAQNWALPSVRFDAVLCTLDDQSRREVAVLLATRPGPVVTPIAVPAGGDAPLHRLVHERSVSINTAAAGGNASLMAVA